MNCLITYTCTCWVSFINYRLRFYLFLIANRAGGSRLYDRHDWSERSREGTLSRAGSRREPKTPKSSGFRPHFQILSASHIERRIQSKLLSLERHLIRPVIY